MIRDDGSHRTTRPQPPVKSETELDQEMFDSKMRQWFQDLDQDTHKKLSHYYGELVRFNKAINLVSPNTLMPAEMKPRPASPKRFASALRIASVK